MTTRPPTAAVLTLLFLTLGVAACHERSPAAPTTRAPIPPTVPASGEPVNGVAYDSGLRPLAGATVEILDGPQAGTSTTANAQGEFSLRVTVDDATRFRASKAGYVAATVTPQPYCDRCNPRRWVFFYLDVLDPPVAIGGDYTLTFIADAACTNLPEELRTRTYAATIQLGRFTYPGFPPDATTSFKLTPSGSAFADNLNFFWLNVAGNYIAISLGDHTDPGLTERLADHTYVAFGGWAAVSVATPVSTIATSFEGWIDYCSLQSDMGPRYDCTPARGVTRVRCDSKSHRLILTHR